jgi:bifunctional pyridoxal-dependent enzyme with beta-cystathionase and maltose regulon repressor activities
MRPVRNPSRFKVLERIADLCAEHDVWVLADEIHVGGTWKLTP